MTKKAILYTDGASSGNPGPAGIGYVLSIGDKKKTCSAYIGITTNNVAEYTALVKGLEMALREGVKEIEVYMDSELVVRQLLGLYRVRQSHLRPLYERACELLRTFQRYQIRHVSRDRNKEADRLSKEAIRGATGTDP